MITEVVKVVVEWIHLELSLYFTTLCFTFVCN